MILQRCFACRTGVSAPPIHKMLRDKEVEERFCNDEQRWSFFVLGHNQCSCSSTLIGLTGEVEFLHANLLNRKFNTKLRQMQISKDTFLVSHCESDEERSTIWCIRRIHQAAVVVAFHLPHHLQGLFSETRLPLKTLIPTCRLIISDHQQTQIPSSKCRGKWWYSSTSSYW